MQQVLGIFIIIGAICLSIIFEKMDNDPVQKYIRLIAIIFLGYIIALWGLTKVY